MNEKARAELVRQLMSAGHHFARCSDCGGSWKSEFPIETCPYGCGKFYLEPDPNQAEFFYRSLIHHAIKWGDQ